MEDARTELHQLFRAWLWHAIAQEEDKPLMSLYHEKRLEARRALKPVRRERKQNAKMRKLKDKEYRERKEERVLRLARLREMDQRLRRKR
jgi:hypothetical protein